MAMTQKPIYWRYLHVSTIYKAYFSGLCKGISPPAPPFEDPEIPIDWWLSHPSEKYMKVSFPLSRCLPKSRMAMQKASLACFLHQLCTPSTLHIIFCQLGLLFLHGK